MSVVRTGDLTYLGDTDNHVRNVTFKGVNGASLLVATEPHADSEMGSTSLGCTFREFLDFARQVAEILSNFASGSFHGHFSGLDAHVNCTQKFR